MSSTIHPLAERASYWPAAVSGIVLGCTFFVSGALLAFELFPGKAWLPAYARETQANIDLLDRMLKFSAWRALGNHGPEWLLAFFSAILDTLRSTDISHGVALKGTALCIGSWWAGMSAFSFTLSHTRKKIAAEHVSGPQLLQGAAAISAVQQHWDQRIRREGRGVEMSPGVSMPIGVEREHVALFGPPGSGKTTVMTGLARQAVARGDRVLWLDLKGDGAERVGHSARVIGLTAQASVPLALGQDLTEQLQDLEFAKSIIPTGDDNVWTLGAQRVLSGLNRIARARFGENWDARHLNRLLHMPMDDVHSLMQKQAPDCAEYIDSADDKAKIAFSFWITVLAYAGPVMLSLAHAHQPGQKPLSLKSWALGDDGHAPIVMSVDLGFEELSGASSRLALGIVARAMAGQAATEGRDHRLWLCLDEASRIGRCRAILTLTSLGRSKGVRVLLAPQSPSDLETVYGPTESSALLENFGLKIIMRVAPGASLRRIADDWIGKRLVSWVTSAPNDGAKPTQKLDDREIPVVEPSKLSSWLGLQTSRSGQLFVRGIVLGFDDVIALEWPVTGWPKSQRS